MGHLTRATVMEGFRERSLGCATIMLCILGAAHAFVPSFLRPESFSMRSNRYMLSLDTRSALDFDGRAERRPWPASTRLHGRRSCNERRVLRMLDASEAEKDPQLIVAFLMKSLQLNDFPEIDSGLTTVWEFSGDTTKGIFKHNLTGAAMLGKNWTIERPLVMVGGNTSDSWIATHLMKTVSSDGRMRRWQWEFRKRRRPPKMGTWYVESIGSSDKDGNFIADA